MNVASRTTIRTFFVAVRALLLFTLVLGVGYMVLVTALGQAVFSAKADGSLIEGESGAVTGSRLIGQSFHTPEGEALPQYFQSRPSAAGEGYDVMASSGSNLGPENEELIAQIRSRKQAIATLNGVSPAEVPADAVTASGSGLDPHISPAYAAIQVERVAKARGIAPEKVAQLVEAHTQGRDLGYIGEPVVNVVNLNLALDELDELEG